MTSAETAVLGRQGIGASSAPVPRGDGGRPANGVFWTWQPIFMPGTPLLVQRAALAAFRPNGAHKPDRKSIRR